MRLSLLLLFFIAPLVIIEVACSPVQPRTPPICITIPMVLRDGGKAVCEN